MLFLTPAIKRRESWFWSHVEIKGPNDCWKWKRAKKDGYGRVTILGVTYRAHRIALLYKLEKIEHWALHINDCQSRACCNQNHLYEGTMEQNNQDIYTKYGREPYVEINLEIAREIRGLQGLNLRQLSEKFGLSQQSIYRIRTNQTWKEPKHG
jgi:hypothetical protein